VSAKVTDYFALKFGGRRRGKLTSAQRQEIKKDGPHNIYVQRECQQLFRKSNNPLRFKTTRLVKKAISVREVLANQTHPVRKCHRKL
jgi:hypothetical protein